MSRAAASTTPSPAKLSEGAQYEAALRYLDRRDGSVAQVRRALQRRIQRYGDDSLKQEALDAMDRVLNRLIEARLLDDARFARAYVESQRNRGISGRHVQSKLAARGVSSEHVEAALLSTSESELHDEDAAAANYVRKRRLKEKFDLSCPLQRNKALSALGRRGFSFDVARRALGL